jgi:hypothetical protein
MKIFVSYSQEDKELARNLKRSFEEYDNIECFMAHDAIEPGSARANLPFLAAK